MYSHRDIKRKSVGIARLVSLYVLRFRPGSFFDTEHRLTQFIFRCGLTPSFTKVTPRQVADAENLDEITSRRPDESGLCRGGQ